MPIRQLVAQFEKADDLWRANPKLRGRVRWGRVNHARPLPEVGRYEVIFCRYVLNDFSPEKRVEALQELARCITPGGVLIMGEGETPLDIGGGFRAPANTRGLYQRDPAQAVA